MISLDADEILFYDAGGVQKLPDGHFETWLKALPENSCEEEANKVDHARARRVARKIASGYVPPIAFQWHLTRDQSVYSVVLEDIANEASVDPKERMLVELDCSNRMVRFLSVQTKKWHAEKPSEWAHIAPETNYARLALDLCR